MREPLDNIAKYFHYLWAHPLHWSPAKQKLEFSPISIKHIPFICAVVFSLVPFVAANYVLATAQLFGLANLSFRHLMVTAAMLILSGFILLVELICVAYGKEFAVSFNALKLLDNKLRKQLELSHVNLPIKGAGVGVALNTMIFLFSIYPYMYLIFGGYQQELDPYALIYWQIIAQNRSKVTPWYFHFRLAWVLAANMQIGRMLAVIICVPAASVQLIIDCISHLDKISNHIVQSADIVQSKDIQTDAQSGDTTPSKSKNIKPEFTKPGKRIRTRFSTISEKMLLSYRGLEIALLIGCDFIRTGMIVAMATAFIAIVLFNFVALKMYGIIPMPFYLFYPLCSLVTSTAIQILLPRMINVYESSNELIQKWKQQLRRCKVNELKYMTRKLKAVKVVKLHGGLFGFNIYALSKGTRSGFNFEMLNYTITGLLAVQ